MIYSPEVHFENAKTLSASTEERHLRYCCLELRYCIEAIVYQKLSAFRDIPNTIMETWEPHKAIKMLARIDEFADKNCMLEINLSCSETPPNDGWIPLGEQIIPPVKWLAKNHNKLGNFLHLPMPIHYNSFNTEKIKKCVLDVLNDIEKYISKGIWIRASGIELQSCLECSKDLIFNRNQLRDGDIVECDSCHFLYKVKSKGSEKLTLSYAVRDLKCSKCNEILQITDRKIMRDLEFTCDSCGQEHVVIKEYRYSAKS